MILKLSEQLNLNKIIDKYAEISKAEWISRDETIQYKNTIYQSEIVCFGVGECKQHLTDEEMYADIELGHYYNKQGLYYLLVENYADKIRVRAFKSNGKGLNGSKHIETIEL